MLALKPNLDLERNSWPPFSNKLLRLNGRCKLSLKGMQAARGARRGRLNCSYVLSTEINVLVVVMKVRIPCTFLFFFTLKDT
jgi:hypothetical protein